MMQDVREMAVGYYECSTSGSTAAKTITIDSSVSLSTKILCKVKFVEKNTANNATMNINGTGAKALYYNGVRVAANNSWYPNEVVDLYYDGTNYQAKSCADTLEYNVSLHQTHEITEITTTTRTLVFNGNVVSSWESETPVSDSSVEGYTRSESNTGDIDSTTIDGPNATYNSTTNKTNVVYVTTHTYTHVVNNYTFQEAVNAVPMSYRHGGLKLSFITNSNSSVQTSDNKYVQYRLTTQTFSTSEADWECIEDSVNALEQAVGTGGSVDERIAAEGVRHYLKAETYTKTEVDASLTDKIDKAVSITYTALKAARDGGTLLPGQYYRITDYVTTTAQAETQSAGHPFDIIVMATAADALSEDALAVRHEGDTYFKDANLEAWRLKYTLDNDYDRFAWCQHESIIIRNYEYLRSEADDVSGVNYPYCWKQGYTKRYTNTATPTAGTDVAKGNTAGTGTNYQIQTVNTIDGTQRGVIYWMQDEWGNECPYDFKNIMFASYKITAMAKVPDIVGQYGGYKVGNTMYPSGVTLENEAVFRYTFDYMNGNISHDATIYQATQSATHCHGNIIGSYYVGKHLTLNNIVIGGTTFAACYGNEFGVNCRHFRMGYTCYGNRFGVNNYQNTCGNYNQNNTWGNYNQNNTWGNFNYSNTWGNYCSNNTWGDYCSNNTWDNYCSNNTWGNNNWYNTWGNNNYYNTWGNNNYSNTWGNSNGSNTWGNSNGSNTWGNSNGSNMWGNSNQNNTWGNSNQNNTWDNSNQNNTWGNSNTCMEFSNPNGITGFAGLGLSIVEVHLPTEEDPEFGEFDHRVYAIINEGPARTLNVSLVEGETSLYNGTLQLAAGETKLFTSTDADESFSQEDSHVIFTENSNTVNCNWYY
jgi:hypothetical protein